MRLILWSFHSNGARDKRERQVALLLLRVEVADGGAVLHSPHPSDRARLVEKGLGQRGLPRPAVADEGDVADLLGRKALHESSAPGSLSPICCGSPPYCCMGSRSLGRAAGSVCKSSHVPPCLSLEPLHVRQAPPSERGAEAPPGRRQPSQERHHGRSPHAARHADGGRRLGGHRQRRAAGRLPAARPHRGSRRARRCSGQGLGHGVTSRRVLRLGRRPRHRRAAARRRRVVSSKIATAATSRCSRSPCSA